jgi:nucleoside-diphosphate-sugar epimerase
VPTIGVTGAAGPLGAALVDRLRDHPGSFKIVALDTTRRHAPGATWRVADVRDPALASRLVGIDTLVHLATDRSPTTPDEERQAVNVRGTQVLLDAAVATGVSRVVLVTSAMVYGAAAGTSMPLEEDAPAIAEPPRGLVADWLAVEAAAQRVAATSGLEVTIVRPASLVGPVADGLLPGLFEAFRLLAIRDSRCAWQFCHVEDLTGALVAAALGEVSGMVTVGSDGALTRKEVEAISGMRSIVLPASVALATAERLHRVRALAAPASDIQYLIEPWTVGSQRLRAIGWAPQWTNEEALRDHLRRLGDRAGRGLVVVDRRDATRAAAGAGATLAVIGSLALVRSRGRRR